MKDIIKKMIEDISGVYSDELIELLIEEAINEVKRLRHNDDVSEYSSLITKMVRYKVNMLGKEGVTAENYNAASFSYTSDYPEDILRELKAIRKVKFI